MPGSQIIHVLPQDVANMIAAGEVVDRPCSVLKELLENAVDAGARRIEIEIVSGGRKLVAVSDDGRGMSRDDALLSIERHATSKITTVHDIESISTMGFRGEALAAISAVSRFRLATRSGGDHAGTEIKVSGGRLLDVKDAGGPVGTRIEVRDLFFNVPARRKFLRSEQTELHHIRQTFLVQALAHPDAAMSLAIDGKPLHNLAPAADPADRIRDLFGASYARNLRPLDHERRGVRVKGFTGLPAISRTDRNEQFVFVNSRPAGAPVLSHAIREGYRTLLAANRHPSVFLFVSLDPALVDVNVHPTKREVRFRRPDEVRDAVIEAIRSGLSGGGSGGEAGGEPPEGMRPAPSEPIKPAFEIADLPFARAFSYPRMPMERSAAPEADLHARQAAAAPGAEGKDPLQAEHGRAKLDAPWSWCRVLGQAGGLYVFLETEEGFAVMDPHAAHERVLFERFMGAVEKGGIESQGLLIPETVELMPGDALRIRKNMEILKALGFGVSEFGGDAFVVDAMPSCFAGVAARKMLLDIAQSLEQYGSRGQSGRGREEAIAQAACKAAVKARDRMTLREIEQLVVDLAGTEMPYTCPHGRPTLIFTSFGELDRKFGRGIAR